MSITRKFPICLVLLAGFCVGCGNASEQDTPETSEATAPTKPAESKPSGDSTPADSPVTRDQPAIPMTDAKPKDEDDESKNPAHKEELDNSVVATWREAGALVGWLVQSEFGEWLYLRVKPEDVDSLPVFLWQEFQPGVIVKLPVPSVPFAIGLGGTGMNNAGLKELAGLHSLQALDLSHTQVTDAGLKELAAIKSLRSLDLGASAVTDAGLKELAAVKSLQKLYFGSTAVTDAGVKELAGLKDLQTLYLYNTSVTDTGLVELASFKTLQMVLLSKTQVTDEGVAELAKVHPKLNIVR